MRTLGIEADARLRERGQRTWLDRLESERGNLQAALGFLLGPADDPERALRLATALFWFWNIRGHLSEGPSWFVRAVDRADPLRTGAVQRASALPALATFEWQEGNRRAARAHIEESVALFGRLERRPTREHAMALCVQAMGAVFQEEEATAIAAAEESVRMFSDIGAISGVALALNPIAKVKLQQGELAAARAAFEPSLALFRELGNNWGARYSTHELSEQRRPLETARCLIGLAGAAAGCGDLRRPARTLGAVERVVESDGIALAAEDIAQRDRTTIAIRAVLDEALAQAQWLEGRKMAVAPAIVLGS